MVNYIKLFKESYLLLEKSVPGQLCSVKIVSHDPLIVSGLVCQT